MMELMRHIKQDHWMSLYKPKERNHVLKAVYTAILAAARGNSDRLVLTSSQISWYRNGDLVREFFSQPLSINPSRSFSENLRTMLERDITIRQHIEIVSETPDVLVINLK